jgi:hypothetical protein
MMLTASGWFCNQASASIKDKMARRQTTSTWHGGYYDAAWGTPVAVVITPRAKTQTNLGSGIGGTTVTRIQPQFTHEDPGPSTYQRSWFRPTPAWPSNTDQFGDYYIRGPR